MMTIGSLFSGIGGLELGLEMAGLGPTLWQVERDTFCRSVLARHWPNAERFDDVETVTGADLAPVGIVCGGFPCQPVSVAGKRRAQADERWLWPHFRRIVEATRPGVVVVENVLGLRTAGLRDVLADLAAIGFDAEWSDLSAFELGAPHVRRRLFLVATDPERISVRDEPGWLSRAFRAASAPIDRSLAEGLSAAYPDGLRRLESAWRLSTERGWPRHDRWDFDRAAGVDDGSPVGMVGAKRKAAGNAVVPRCAEVVGWVIRELAGLTEAA